MEQVCRNCGYSFNGAYCNNCGQKFDVSRFTFKHIFEEALHAFTHADKSFLAYIQKLFIHPGKLSYEYIIECKRKKYYNPFTFFVLITAIDAFAESFDINIKEKLFNENNEYGHIFNVYSKLLYFALIPLFAFVMWLVHSKKPRIQFSECTVFAMILVSMYSMIETLVHSINYLSTLITHTYVALEDNLFYFFFIMIYITTADYAFYKPTVNSSWIRSAVTGLSFLLIMLAIQLFTVYAFINHFRGIGRFDLFGIKINY
ncbi:MAG: DUF3667 domain-containing protein [Parafilimonas sp.]